MLRHNIAGLTRVTSREFSTGGSAVYRATARAGRLSNGV